MEKETIDSRDHMKREELIFLGTILILAMILGAIVRIHYISGSDLPINDGGLFYQMTEDLLENNFSLPKYSSYNREEIPYAYPPLGFYLTGLISRVFGIELLVLFRLLPCYISIGTILPAWLLFKRILPTRFQTAAATFIFAMIPRSFEWFVYGGGITRSLSFFFAIFSFWNIWRLFSENSGVKEIIGTIVFSSLTLLSHPETGLFVALAALVFFFYHEPSRINLIRSGVVAIGVILVALPWAFSVAAHHGIQPFIDAGGTGHKLWFEIGNLITLNFGFENDHLLTVTSILAIIGIFNGK
jgi:uncharacterized membrane protein